jgi:acyl dehydratase
MATKELTTPPNLPRLFATSLVPGLPSWAGGTSPAGLPDLEVALGGQHVDQQELAIYDRVCGLRFADTLPPTYLHVLAFPLSVQLMTDRSFPYPLVGLVHVANRMTQYRPVQVSEELAFRVRAGRLRAHSKGVVFDVLAEARVGEELVWSGESTYLRQGASMSDEGELPESLPGDTVTSELAPPDDAPAAIWTVPGGTGRAYARVSGDVNPIHLHPLTAKAFGFPRNIAHGMWTHARALGGLEGELPDAFVVDVRFQKPILLPARVAFTTFEADGGTAFVVQGTKKPEPHMGGTIRGL